VHWQIIHAAIVDDAGYFQELFTIEGAAVVEIEAELIGTDVRALLTCRVAEDILQGAMEEVRRGVVPAGAVTAMYVDFGVRQVADVELALGMSVMDDMPRAVEAGVVDDEDAAGGANPAGITDLSATFGIKRRRFEDEERSLALAL
jgi:hypothetical protein